MSFFRKTIATDKPTISFKQKLISIALQIVIPTITSAIICKIIDTYFKKTNSKVREILDNHAKTMQTGVTSNTEDYLNVESLKRNGLLFSASFVITYFITKFFMREKETTDLQRLTNFIKDWPNNKIQIPKTFQEQFESLYSDYVKNNKINITEQEAEKIVFQIISQIIEYKTSLPRSTHLFTKI